MKSRPPLALRCCFGDGDAGHTDPIFPFVADGRIFRRLGVPVVWRGLTAFQLLDRFARGEDIDPFLAAYPLANILRVWPYVPWPGTGWEAPPVEVALTFLQYLRNRGRAAEFTLLTDDDPRRLPWARQYVEALVAANPDNLALEAGNEPITHKSIDTSALRAVLEAAPFPYASGHYEDYEDVRQWYGRYTTVHTPRDEQWPRKAKDLWEFNAGWDRWRDDAGVEHPPFAGTHHPCVADEPGKPQDVGFVEADFYAYAAVAGMLGAGATWHCESAKYGALPTDDEARCADAFYRGLQVFPDGAALHGYWRIDEHGNTLRTFLSGQGGPYMVRIRPMTREAPESGWEPLDELGICWRRA